MTIRAGRLRLRSEVEDTRGAIPDRRFCIALAAEQGNAALAWCSPARVQERTQGLRAIKAAMGFSLSSSGNSGMARDAAQRSCCRSCRLSYHRKRIAGDLGHASPGRIWRATAPEAPARRPPNQISWIILVLRSALIFACTKRPLSAGVSRARMALRKSNRWNQYAEILKQNPEEGPRAW